MSRGPVRRSRYVPGVGNTIVHLPVYVYAYVDTQGQHLYVGHTFNPQSRHHAHRAKSPWWDETTELVYLGEYATKGEGLAAEAEAIRALRPLHNIHHNRSAA